MRIQILTSYKPISPRMSDLIVLESGQNISNIDFGLINKGSISGLAWIDVDGNGEVNTGDNFAEAIEVAIAIPNW